MGKLLKELEELWLKLTEEARVMLLAGRATLKDMRFFADHPKMSLKNMGQWVDKHYPSRRDKFVTRMPQISRPIADFDSLKTFLSQVTAQCHRIVEAFLSSLLTLEQVRYAHATCMGPRALHHFCNIDDPNSVLIERTDRRYARREGALLRERHAFNRDHRRTICLRRFLGTINLGSARPTVHISTAGQGVDGRPLASLYLSP